MVGGGYDCGNEAKELGPDDPLPVAGARGDLVCRDRDGPRVVERFAGMQAVEVKEIKIF
jgi:hypothetical protein